MELKLLRTFVAVAECRHFAKAADACNLSQPAVSHQIAALEREMGARLLNRTGRQVSLTVAGEVLLDETRRILGAVDRARERMQEVTSGVVGRIRLGASATPGLYLLPDLLAEYRRRHPRYELQFQIGPVGDLCDRVARNELDMAVIARKPPTEELRARTLVEDELVVVSAPRPSGKRSRRIAPQDLAAECWILQEDGSETRRHVTAWLTAHGISPVQTMTFAGPDAVKRAVTAGLGVSMVSKLTVEDELKSRRVIAVPMSVALPTRPFYLVDHPQKHHGAACQAMLALLDAQFAMLGGTASSTIRRAVRDR